MRVLLVTHYYSRHGGGIEIVAEQLARRLVADHEMQIRWAASDTDPAPDELPDGLTRTPMRAWNWTERRLGFPWPVWGPGSAAVLWHLVGEADLVHVHDALYPGSLLAVLFARTRRKPVLVTQHVGLIPYESRLARAAMAAGNVALGRAVHRAADRSVFCSHLVRDYYAHLVRFRRPAEVVPNGVDTAMFFPADDEKRRRLRGAIGLPADGPVFLFVGRFVGKKGLPILRALAGEFREVTWVFAGHGAADPAGWSLGNVIVHTGLAGPTLRPLYQAADLLVLPSVGEGFPLVVQEAMACGTPALVNSELAQAQPQAAALLLRERVPGPGRTDETARLWAARIRDLLAEPGRCAGMRPAVAAFAREHWSWDAAAQRYAAIMRDLVEGGR